MSKHLFREYPIVKETWEKLNIIWPILDANTDFKDWIKSIFEPHSTAKCRMIACALWETDSYMKALNLRLHLGLREVEVEEEVMANDRSWTKSMRETSGQRVEGEDGSGFE
ncbi:hypothetical protein J1N35_023208 [Gossypium stocksii]|uniref:Uncharacterized protein n=1 Tax=Gossypium stocksii TaxID=47602 RepID=A0A9D3VJB1_9ROSI|nr:hypothetical protein J1N35_023208 [Gossypium stocksii]